MVSTRSARQPTPAPTSRQCTGCGQWRPVAEFWPVTGRQPATTADRHPLCRACAVAHRPVYHAPSVWQEPPPPRKRLRDRVRERQGRDIPAGG